MLLSNTKSGNIPLIMLGSDRDNDGQPYVASGMDPSGYPLLNSIELFDVLPPKRFAVWLPTPTAPMAMRPRRSLQVCWYVKWQKFGGVSPQAFDLPQFEIVAAARPSRPDSSHVKPSSPVLKPYSLAGLTLGQVNFNYAAATSGYSTIVTAIEGIKAPIEVMPDNGDALCFLRMTLASKGSVPNAMHLTCGLFGMAVDQW